MLKEVLATVLAGLMIAPPTAYAKEKIVKKEPRPQEVHIYDAAGHIDIKSKKVARLYGIVDKKGFELFEDDMFETALTPGDRVVLIDSHGGLVDYGNKMISMIEREQREGTRIVCFVTQFADSMAFNFLTHCDLRLASEDATMLAHKIEERGLDKLRTRLTAKNLRRIADEIDRDDEPFRRANAKAMHLSLEDYDLFADAETRWQSQTLRDRGYLAGICTLEK